MERIILSVGDQNGGSNACVALYRTRPNKGTVKIMAYQCSGGSQPGVINYTDDTIDGPVVWPSHGVYLYLGIYGPSVNVYGVRIEYKRNI